MGTDIFLWVEYKNYEGKWVEPTPMLTECYDCGGSGLCDTEEGDVYDCYKCTYVNKNILKYRNAFSYERRCYEIFAILANVRNSFNIIPISNLYMIEDKDYDHVYCRTLTQLKEYDWDSVEKEVTWIKDEEFYKHFIPALEKLAYMHGGSDNVRILFSFDN